MYKIYYSYIITKYIIPWYQPAATYVCNIRSCNTV